MKQSQKTKSDAPGKPASTKKATKRKNGSSHTEVLAKQQSTDIFHQLSFGNTQPLEDVFVPSEQQPIFIEQAGSAPIQLEYIDLTFNLKENKTLLNLELSV